MLFRPIRISARLAGFYPITVQEAGEEPIKTDRTR